MKNIQKITIISLALLLSASVFGQKQNNSKPNREKIKAMKVGFITEKLDLTTAEAQKFWPVYNEFESFHLSNRPGHYLFRLLRF